MNNRFIPSSDPIDNPPFTLNFYLILALLYDKSVKEHYDDGVSFSISSFSVAYHFPTHSVIATF